MKKKKKRGLKFWKGRTERQFMAVGILSARGKIIIKKIKKRFED